MAKFQFQAWLNESPSTATVTLNGTEIFSGEVAPGNPAGETVTLCEVDAAAGPVEITVNSGFIKVGQVRYAVETLQTWDRTKSYDSGVYVQTDSAANCYLSSQAVPSDTSIDDGSYWVSLGYCWSPDVRSNIELDGAAPTWPEVEPYPGGTPEDPNWAGWFFDVAEGNTITFDINDAGS